MAAESDAVWDSRKLGILKNMPSCTPISAAMKVLFRGGIVLHISGFSLCAYVIQYILNRQQISLKKIESTPGVTVAFYRIGRIGR